MKLMYEERRDIKLSYPLIEILFNQDWLTFLLLNSLFIVLLAVIVKTENIWEYFVYLFWTSDYHKPNNHRHFPFDQGLNGSKADSDSVGKRA